MATSDIFKVVVGFISAACLYMGAKLYRARADFYYSKVKKGLPMPKWHPIFGHLLVMDDIFKTYNLPIDVQRHDIFAPLSEEFEQSDSLYYMDPWPFINPLLLISSPNYAIQACQQGNVNKPADLIHFLHPIAGGNSMFTANGTDWKTARTLLSAGFNESYLARQAAHVVQEAKIYLEVLQQHADKQDIFLLDDVHLNYTIDIAGILTLNRELNAQKGLNTFVSAMQRTIYWHYKSEHRSPLIRWSPFIPFMSWYNGRQMNAYISDVLDERYNDWRTDNVSTQTRKAAIDLILAEYMSTHKDKAGPKLEPSFKKWAVVQLRLLIFAAHDSTSATMSYSLYMLSKHDSILEKLREEHDKVFGTDLEILPDLLGDQPHLLNKLSYTTAVIKEVLRLYPPAAGFRLGHPDIELHDTNGNSYPTDGCRVYVLHAALHRNPKYWKDPNAFIPERWLVGPEDPLYPVKGAWRPFEFGPRNCIGQALSMLDLKITLAMVVRRFDFKDCYDEWDRINNVTRTRTFRGERAYQFGGAGAHPADGLPCRVFSRK